MATPNILIILADDVGVDMLRINKATKTVTAHLTGGSDSAGPVALPTIEKLLKAGVHFEHAWSNPVCTPTRASLWTGLNAWKTRLGYSSGGLTNLETPAVDGTPIVTFGSALTSPGDYRCAMFGKWDLGVEKNPVEWGWTHFAGTYEGGLRGVGISYYGFPSPGPVRKVDLEGKTTDYKPLLQAHAQEVLQRLQSDYPFFPSFLAVNPDLRYYIWHKDTVTSNGTESNGRSPLERTFLYATADQVHDTKKWIAAQKGLGPWCATLCLFTPHDPAHIPPPGTYTPTLFTNTTKPTTQEMMVAMLESMDRYLGDLLASIDDQLANTVVIFTGDNGTQDFDPDTRTGIDAVIGDDKSSRAVGAVQIPMIVADGGLMKGGTACYLKGAPRTVTEPVHIIDLYRTGLSIAGIASDAETDSISLAPHLTNSAGPKRTLNFSQMYDTTQPLVDDLKPSRGINASIFDGKNRLTCAALLGGGLNRTFYVGPWGSPARTPHFFYELSTVEPDPNIPGSFFDNKLPAIVRRGDRFEVLDLTLEAKILQLYQEISKERLDDKNEQFPVIVAASLVANWRMSEGAGAQLPDRSGRANHTTVAPAAWGADTKFPQVLKFPGTGGIAAGKGPSLAGKTPFTVSAWIKTNSPGVIVQQRDPVDFNGQYQLRVDPDGTVVFWVYGEGDTQFNLVTTAKVNDNNWHHVTAVRNGDKGIIYLDGELTPAATGTGPARDLKASIAVGIGADIRDGNKFFKGAMFDLRIYRVALGPREIALDLVEPLVGHWPLDENAGKKVFDRVPPRPAGTITGGAAWVDVPHGLNFDGASSIQLGTTASLAGKGDFTVSAWVQTQTKEDGTAGVIIQQRDANDFNGQYLLSVNANGTVQFMVYGDGNYQWNIRSTAKVEPGKWHLVVAVRDGQVGTVYIDGVPAGRAEAPARTLKSTIAVAIGADIRDNNKHFLGQIRKVRIYKSALSQDRIDALYAMK